jgi:hypothetical protein
MTAQVAVLNCFGIALASDSAVTVTAGRSSSSYNSPDKLFPVPAVPVAVLHSGRATLYGVPWQVLVKQWAFSRDAIERDDVEAYCDEFSAWLSAQHGLLSEESEIDFFRWAVRDYLLMVRDRILAALETHRLENEVTWKPSELVANVVDGVVRQAQQDLESLVDFDGLSETDAEVWCAGIQDDLEKDIEWVFDDVAFTEQSRDRARRIARLLVHKTEPFGSDATLSFAGYGKADFFPSMFRLTISGSLRGSIRAYAKDKVTISRANQVTISPLGMTDAIQSFLRGLSPQYRSAAHRALDAFADDVTEGEADRSAIADPLEQAHARLEESLDSIEWEEFLQPMLDVVQTLPMAEMVRLADALVGLAALRQVVRGESSVGGPVDLAQLTRDGGFEWVRSKSQASPA